MIDKGGDYGGHWHGGTTPCPTCQRIPAPYMPSTGPSCPICRNSNTERMNFGPAQWLCPSCYTVFNGTQDEWLSNSARREKHDKWVAAKAARRGEQTGEVA